MHEKHEHLMHRVRSGQPRHCILKGCAPTADPIMAPIKASLQQHGGISVSQGSCPVADGGTTEERLRNAQGVCTAVGVFHESMLLYEQYKGRDGKVILAI